MSRRWLLLLLAGGICGTISGAHISVAQDIQAADPQDPFVRGLVRLDEKLRLQREAERLAREAYAREQGTPSPETSRVIDTLSVFLPILSISST